MEGRSTKRFPQTLHSLKAPVMEDQGQVDWMDGHRGDQLHSHTPIMLQAHSYSTQTLLKLYYTYLQSTYNLQGTVQNR